LVLTMYDPSPTRSVRSGLCRMTSFFREHEPPYLCVYCLVIGYENFLEPGWANVEHGEAKAGHPDKRFDKANLYISCQFHNKDKGTADIDEYIAKLKKEGHGQNLWLIGH
jgi:hypothetical protein